MDSSVAPKEPQDILLQEISSRKKSFSSRFVSLLHSANCFKLSEASSRDARSSSKSSHRSDLNSPLLDVRSSPQRSHPKMQNAKFFTKKDRPSNGLECVTGNENSKIIENSEAFLDSFPVSVNGSHSTSHDSGGYLSYLTEFSTFMSAELFEFLQPCLPNIIKGCQWILIYSTWKHGISLHTLLRNSANFSGPCLLIVGDTQGAIFGGLIDGPLKPTANKYQGTNQMFVFTTISGEPTLFKATGSNRFYYLCSNDLLAFGGGGSFALYLDKELLYGSSGPCGTFGSSCLAHNPEFALKNVEIKLRVDKKKESKDLHPFESATLANSNGLTNSAVLIKQ